MLAEHLLFPLSSPTHSWHRDRGSLASVAPGMQLALKKSATPGHTPTHTLSKAVCQCTPCMCMYITMFVAYPQRICSPSQTCSPGLWSILRACSSRLFGLSQCDRFFFLPGCWRWCQNWLSSRQQLHSRRHRYLRQSQHRCQHAYDDKLCRCFDASEPYYILALCSYYLRVWIETSAPVLSVINDNINLWHERIFSKY